MRTLILLLLIFLSQTLPAQELVLDKASDKVTIRIPANFHKLTPEEAQRRYLSPHAPLAMYSDANNETDLVLNNTNAFFDAKDIPIMRDFYRSTLRSLYSKVTFIREAQETIGKRKALVFEFTSELQEKNKSPLKKYTYIQYILWGQRVVVCSFTCDERLRPKYQLLISKVMPTVRL